MTSKPTELDTQELREPLKPKFLDLIENEYAGEGNPNRVGIFIRRGSRANGQMNPGAYLVLTDGKGRFWEIGNRRDHRMKIVGNLIAQREQAAELRGRVDELEKSHGSPLVAYKTEHAWEFVKGWNAHRSEVMKRLSLLKNRQVTKPGEQQ